MQRASAVRHPLGPPKDQPSAVFFTTKNRNAPVLQIRRGKTKDSSECILEVHETRVPGLMAPTKRRWLSETGCLSSRDDQASNIPSWVILQQSFVLECFWQPLTVAQRLSVSNPKFASPFMHTSDVCLHSFGMVYISWLYMGGEQAHCILYTMEVGLRLTIKLSVWGGSSEVTCPVG